MPRKVSFCHKITAAGLAAVFFSTLAGAAKLSDAGAVPHLDAFGQAAYREFIDAGAHRAFVIAPGGAWAWKADAVSAEAATRDALQSCQQQAGSPCVPYAIDERVAFDAQKWPTLWGRTSTVPRPARPGWAKSGASVFSTWLSKTRRARP